MENGSSEQLVSWFELGLYDNNISIIRENSPYIIYCCYRPVVKHFAQYFDNMGGGGNSNSYNSILIWNAVTVLCGQLDCDHGHL